MKDEPEMYRVESWPNSSTSDGRWATYMMTGHLVSLGGQEFVRHGDNLVPTGGWHRSKAAAYAAVAEKIEAAGHAALRQAEELRAGNTEPAVS